ncbi:C39 family peptidase [Streptomyces sp. NBC_01023]|uniref:papain-like cysteine protease family protein n=1 Tax=unclassified Streptomyces TaxID=2593676 RepID=UPI0030E3BE97|nr:C39 family peptidase [Streptomyces sp. NBC_01023]
MRTHRRRLSLAAIGTAAALFALPATTASATAPHSPAAPATMAAAATAAKRLNITMQEQQQTNWCWAATGNTIAGWYGRDYSQNQFCNAAFGFSQNGNCPNDQATLGNVQNGLDWAGISPGSYVTGWLQSSTVQTEINAGRPIADRIQWSSGGGHMNVVYGYDTDGDWIYWGDPWPSDNRYNWASHDWYVSNNEFSWTHSLYRIGA